MIFLMLLGLFTPDWIVEYLVNNTLGQTLNNKKLEDIKFIDPCQGTGNILVYAFDMFLREYLKKGFSKEEAVYNILTKNLYGIDIDENACLITKLVLILKASVIDLSAFEEKITDNMNIICIKNSNNLNKNKYEENPLYYIDIIRNFRED